jgi:hypothetical protein
VRRAGVGDVVVVVVVVGHDFVAGDGVPSFDHLRGFFARHDDPAIFHVVGKHGSTAGKYVGEWVGHAAENETFAFRHDGWQKFSDS